MPDASEKLLHIGIECESLEGDSWGVSRMIRKLLEQLATRPELARTHRFHLYFKKRVPNYPFLDSPLFVKTVTTPPGVPASFNFHYHVWMVARAYGDGVSVLYLPAYQLPLLWFRKSVVMLTEDIWREMRNPKLPLRYRLSYHIFSNWAARAATRVMAISHTSAAGIARLFGIAPSRIVVNELAVDSPDTPSSKLQAPSYLLYVGQAFERRHLREALAAFTDLARDMPDLEFRIVGPDKYNPPLIEQTVRLINQRLGRPAVTWERQVGDQELVAHYAGASALVYVSDAEAFGLPPLEGLSHGVMPVVADAPVSREVYGQHAFYAAQPTVEAIGTALRAALTDEPRRKAIRAAAPDILARYTWKAHTDRWLGIMGKIVNSK